MISTSDLHKGVAIELDGDLWQILDYHHLKIGRGSAQVRIKLRNIKRGQTVERSFQAGEKWPRVQLEHRQIQFLYQDGNDYHFMETDSYEQFHLSAEQLDDAVNYLKDSMLLDRTSYEGETIGVELPVTVDLKVVETEPGFVPSGTVRKVIPMTDIADISGLAWSPDGERIALTGTEDAQGDLWLLDPVSVPGQRLTDDPYAELRPSWSPYGKTLVFATDKGGKTDLAAPVWIDEHRHDGRGQPADQPGLPSGWREAHRPAVFSGWSEHLLRLDPDGVSNIYRYSLPSRTFFVTNVQTGVSSLTELSPCLSVSRGPEKSPSRFSTGAGTRCTRWAPTRPRGAPVRFPDAIDTPSPFEEPPSAAQGPPLAAAPYRTTFQLLSVSGAGVGVSLDQLGPAVGGSVDFVFQDVLGNHLIDTSAQVNGTLDTLGGQLLYIDSANRIQWGIGVGHVPQPIYLLLPSSMFTVPGADTAIVQQQVFTEEVDLLARYPLDLNRRLETDLGYTRISYEQTAPYTSTRRASSWGRTR